MLPLRLPSDKPLQILALGAHADDIEIGAGGALLALLAAYPDARVTWVVMTARGERAGEARASAALFADPSRVDIVLADFRDGYLPYEGAAVKDFVESLKAKPYPDLILTHWRKDAHQDHRLIAELAWNTWRNALIWEFEIPKYDGDLETPSLYVPLTKAQAHAKVDALMRAFPSQAANGQSGKGWFTPDTFLGLMRIRGIECNAPEGYAEGFHAKKVVVGL
jgi:LmbE family N-acetylglucosaminyl deacetylase